MIYLVIVIIVIIIKAKNKHWKIITYEAFLPFLYITLTLWVL